MNNNCPTCGCELSNASFAEDGILCMWCGTINKIEGDPMLPDEPEDPGIDPPFDYSEEEGEPFYCEDLTGQDEDVLDGRWYDYDDGEYEREYE